MKSERRKPYVLVLTNPNFSLSISFPTQGEAQQWFVALTQVAGNHKKLKCAAQ